MAGNVDHHRDFSRYAPSLSQQHPVNWLTSFPAVIIGCCPAFAALVKRTLSSLSASYNSRGYVKGSRGNSIIKMRSRPSRDSKGNQNTDASWAQGHGSREGLAQADARVTPTTTSVDQDEERPPDVPKGYVRKIPTTIR